MNAAQLRLMTYAVCQHLEAGFFLKEPWKKNEHFQQFEVSEISNC